MRFSIVDRSAPLGIVESPGFRAETSPFSQPAPCGCAELPSGIVPKIDPRRRLHSKDVQIFRPACYRLGYFAEEDGSSSPMGRRQTHQRSEVGDKRIAAVFEAKFEPLGR